MTFIPLVYKEEVIIAGDKMLHIPSWANFFTEQSKKTFSPFLGEEHFITVHTART